MSSICTSNITRFGPSFHSKPLPPRASRPGPNLVGNAWKHDLWHGSSADNSLQSANEYISLAITVRASWYGGSVSMLSSTMPETLWYYPTRLEIVSKAVLLVGSFQ